MKIWTRLLLLSFVLFDLGYSFVQHYNEPLDGDLARIVLPLENYSKVLADPFGYNVIVHGETYGAPNRYFIHQGMYSYFRSVPFFLQRFTDPINSVYLSCAIFKIFIQIFLLWLFISYTFKNFDFRDPNILLIAAVATPLFQHTIFNSYLGIISSSITYTWFYAFPIAFLLLFFLPFYKSFRTKTETQKPFSLFLRLVLFFLMLTLSFSGPLIPGIILIICPGIIAIYWHKNYKSIPAGSFINQALRALKAIPKDLLVYFILFSFMCLYSFYIGLYNDENVHKVLLLTRYKLLAQGMFGLLTTKLAYPIMLSLIIVNTILLSKVRNVKDENEMLLETGKFILLFSLVYILLLPLGGYREYRPHIVRSDTLSPVNILLFLFYLKSTFLITKSLKLSRRKFYYFFIFMASAILTISDEMNYGKNSCEKQALIKIAESNKEIVELNADCSVLEFGLTLSPQQSIKNARLIQLWRITKSQKSYYQSSNYEKKQIK